MMYTVLLMRLGSNSLYRSTNCSSLWGRQKKKKTKTKQEVKQEVQICGLGNTHLYLAERRNAGSMCVLHELGSLCKRFLHNEQKYYSNWFGWEKRLTIIIPTVTLFFHQRDYSVHVVRNCLAESSYDSDSMRRNENGSCKHIYRVKTLKAQTSLVWNTPVLPGWASALCFSVEIDQAAEVHSELEQHR